MTNGVVYTTNTVNATETGDPGLCCGYAWAVEFGTRSPR